MSRKKEVEEGGWKGQRRQFSPSKGSKVNLRGNRGCQAGKKVGLIRDPLACFTGEGRIATQGRERRQGWLEGEKEVHQSAMWKRSVVSKMKNWEKKTIVVATRKFKVDMSSERSWG